MTTIEKRLLDHLLTFCQEEYLIGPYRLDGDLVHIIAESEPQTFASAQALRYLVGLTENAGLADQFYETL